MIHDTKFMAKPNQMEIMRYGTEFPLRCTVNRLDTSRDKSFPWHWHKSCEINYLQKGDLDLYYPDGSIHLTAGDCVFINSGILHSYRGCGSLKIKLYAVLFDTGLVSGSNGSAIESKYVFPITLCQDLPIFQIKTTGPSGVHMYDDILRIFDLMRDEPPCYELLVRSKLSDFWSLLYESCYDTIAAASPGRSQDTTRIKQMVAYIQEHYSERITLDDIAASAGISSRECTRCFSRCLGDSPINYLNDFRIHIAAHLLKGSDDSILDISESCGFSSNSYFTKVFRESFGYTPNEYRKTVPVLVD